MRPALVALLLATTLLAGCSDAPSKAPVQVDQATGEACSDVRGVVVDEAIRPIKDAVVAVPALNRTVFTGADGTFTVPCLADGAYLVTVSHPLYSQVQAEASATAGEEPPLLKVQLARVIFGTPYAIVQSFDGFIVCSVGFFVYASEECGEGAGVPCEVPVLGCQRVGGQDNNRAQWDFYLDGPHVRELVVDMTWEPSSPTLKDFYLVLSTEWTCDPFCIGNELNITTGGTPLYLTQGFVNGTAKANTGNITVTPETRFATFVWPDWGHGDPSRIDVAVNQVYKAYATAFYYLPAPEGWSFLTDEVPR